METSNSKEKSKVAMEKTLESFRNELKKVQTGKAQVSMLDPIRVDYYGSPRPLSQVASISCPDPRSFLVSPWEKKSLKRSGKGHYQKQYRSHPFKRWEGDSS